MTSGNHIVDQYESEQRKLDRKPACPHCGSNRTFDEFYCTESGDACEKTCVDICELVDEGVCDFMGCNFYKHLEGETICEAYLKCEFRKEHEMCKDCSLPTGRE